MLEYIISGISVRNLKALRIIPGISGNKNKNKVLDSSYSDADEQQHSSPSDDKMVAMQGLSNESNKVTQAACMRNVVQKTALLEYLK